MKIRSFVAIEFPSSTQDVIIRQTSDLRKHYPNPVIRWVKPGNIHLTLKFLGNPEQTDLEKLASALTHEASQVEPFSISFTSLGMFPNPKNPRIIWIGVNSPSILGELQKQVETITLRHGFQTEKRPFSPHISLGRIVSRDSITNIENLTLELGSVNVSNIDKVKISAIRIFKSDLRANGPIYTSIHNIPFREENILKG